MKEELTNDEVEIDLVDLGYALLDKCQGSGSFYLVPCF